MQICGVWSHSRSLCLFFSESLQTTENEEEKPLHERKALAFYIKKKRENSFVYIHAHTQ